jgi:hypothetical protein
VFGPAASASYGGANAFFDKTFVVTFDLGLNYQLIARHSNVAFRFYVSSDGTVSFYATSAEKTGCPGNSGSTTKLGQSATTSRECDGISDTTTSHVRILGDILTYTETQFVTTSVSRRTSSVRRGYAFRFDGRTCQAIQYIVEGIQMSPVSCQVEDGNADR